MVGRLGHERPLNEQVAFIAGYSHTSSGYTNPRGALKSSGLVEYPDPGRVCLDRRWPRSSRSARRAANWRRIAPRVLGKLAGPQQRILSC
jgi:hypothetical protein